MVMGDALVLDDQSLKNEIALWDKNDRAFLIIMAKFINDPLKPATDLYYNKFKHLGVFYDDKRFNDKGIALVRILQEQ
jgi:hypothetical protein